MFPGYTVKKEDGFFHIKGIFYWQGFSGNEVRLLDKMNTQLVLKVSNKQLKHIQREAYGANERIFCQVTVLRVHIKDLVNDADFNSLPQEQKDMVLNMSDADHKVNKEFKLKMSQRVVSHRVLQHVEANKLRKGPDPNKAFECICIDMQKVKEMPWLEKFGGMLGYAVCTIGGDVLAVKRPDTDTTVSTFHQILRLAELEKEALIREDPLWLLKVHQARLEDFITACIQGSNYLLLVLMDETYFDLIRQIQG